MDCRSTILCMSGESFQSMMRAGPDVLATDFPATGDWAQRRTVDVTPESGADEMSAERRVTRSQTGQQSGNHDGTGDATAPTIKKARFQRRHSGDFDTDQPSPSTSALPDSFPVGIDTAPYQPDRRGPRSRATLPVPVPNLTKKSRGRKVPTLPHEGSGKEKRTYMCTVEGCGKCFNRGEHLKRHIRSIHTNDKPFKCEHLGCGRFFNRHDNLLQHLKVHTHTRASADKLPDVTSPTPPPSSKPPVDDPFTKTTMAVSSARTEIPPREDLFFSRGWDQHPHQQFHFPLLTDHAMQHWSS